MTGARFPSFDEPARERIRQALRRYMQTHNIGAPALQERIAEATNRPSHLVSLKTLQRFLDGQHRTQDSFIALCMSFLAQVVPAPSHENLGYALAAFFSVRPEDHQEEGKRPWAQPMEMLAYDFAGEFESRVPVWTETEFPSRRQFVLDPDPSSVADLPSVPFSTLVLEPLPDTPFLKATEWVSNPARSERPEIEGSDPPIPYEGIFVYGAWQPSTMIFLRNPYVAHPKIYLLTTLSGHLRKPGQQILGRALDPRPQTNPDNPGAMFEIHLIRTA